MNSLQICLLSALLVIAASNPLPDDEPVSPTVAPVVPDVVTPAVKSADAPAAVVTDVSATQKSLVVDNEKVPEPQALPSTKENAASEKDEEKKREVTAEQQPTAKTVGTESKTEEVKSLPEQPKDNVAVADTAAPVTASAEAGAGSEKAEQSQSTEHLRSVDVEKPSEVTPNDSAAVVPEAKNADLQQAVESTIVPVVPSAVASEKKIDADVPAPIVSENVEKPVSEAEGQEQKSALPVAAGQTQAAAQKPLQQQDVAQAQERSASESTEEPNVAASKAEPTVAPSSKNVENKQNEQEDSSSSSEESKESHEETEKKKSV